ncbi:MAG TPA: right-handed parallel beta-helix repeat-containing protein [Myxococcales bacterium]
MVNSRTFSAGDSILFKRGSTWNNETIAVNSSGSSGSPITYGAYGSGAAPLVSGLATVSGWTNEGGGIYSQSIAVESSPTMVTVDGANTAMGRWPNTGWRTITSHSGTTSITDTTLSGTPDWTGAQVVLRVNNWIMARKDIAQHSGNTISYTPQDVTVDDGYGYFIQNDLRALDQFGEWYYSAGGKFYMYFGADDPNAHVVKVSVKDKLAYMVSGKAYVTFDGLSFEGGNVATVDIRGTSHVRIANCNIDFSGMNAINAESCNDGYITVENSSIDHSNSDGIMMQGWSGGGGNFTVRNCTIKNTGIFPGMGDATNAIFAAICMEGHHSIVDHNYIENVGYVGMMFGQNFNSVTNNFVNNYCTLLHDGGGISAGGSSTTSNIISGNIVMNGLGAMDGTPNPGSGMCNGIHLDDNSAGFTVENNTIANVSRGGIFLHSSHDMIVRGNTVYNSSEAQLVMQHSRDAMVNLTISDNIFFAKATTQYVLKFGNVPAVYNAFGTADNNYYLRPFDDGVDFGAGSDYTLTGWQAVSGQDANSHRSPVVFPQYTTNSAGADKVSNGAFASDTSGVICAGPAGTCSWDGSKLDDGTLQVSAPVATSVTLSFPVGAISSDKTYVFKYSCIGTSAAERVVFVYLRQKNSPWTVLSSTVYKKPITTSRSENEVLFTHPIADSDVNVVMDFDAAYSVGDTFWLDNVGLYEADVTMTNPDDKILFDYNYSASDKVIQLTRPMIDARGVWYNNTATISPYSSIILMDYPNAGDAGTPELPPDASVFPVDAAVAGVDASITPVDAAAAGVDASIIPVDAAVAGVDASIINIDSGVNGGTDGADAKLDTVTVGCGCSSSMGGADTMFGCALLVLILARRQRIPSGGARVP